ncbi:DUF2178 domain-containing protein [Halorientalis brevis]|uniref:DUF2178 domain-containing protein n=1 Tax=Halorientalis brevis TaxID=1126241 RepID=A0ABD6C731_9EURY
MPSTHSESTYRRSYIGSWLAGTVAFAGLIVAGYPVVGAVAFGVAALVAINLQRGYEGPLFDERDEDIVKEASANTISIFGVTSAVVFPTMTALTALGMFEWPWWLTPIAWFVTALYLVWGLNLLLARR